MNCSPNAASGHQPRRDRTRLEAASNVAGKFAVLVDLFGPIEHNPIIASRVAKCPPTLIFHNIKDKVVTFDPNSKALDGILPKSVEHRLVPYDEDSPEYGFHPFIKDGHADVDSRKESDRVGGQVPPAEQVIDGAGSASIEAS